MLPDVVGALAQAAPFVNNAQRRISVRPDAQGNLAGQERRTMDWVAEIHFETVPLAVDKNGHPPRTRHGFRELPQNVVPVFIAKSFAIRLVDRRSKRPDCIFHPTEDLPSVLVIRAAEELTGIDTARAREELSEPIAARRGTAVFDLGGKFLQFLFRERSRLDRIAFDKGDVCPIGVLEQNPTPIAFVPHPASTARGALSRPEQPADS
jgi:hypothetical protein